jgi:hypothetical protein
VSDTAIPFPLQPPAHSPAASLWGYSSICALNIMTNNERTQTAIGNQDNRILSSYAWFPSPRQEKTKKAERAEEEGSTENPSWKCACN